MRVSLTISVALASSIVALLGGCYGPPPPLAAGDPPQLRAIQDAFTAAVRRAKTSDAESWYSGWYGNVWVNTAGGNNRGLCWHWQQMVYEGVVETVGRLGWDATGVALNTGTASEHHAVLVFDPMVIEREKILTATRPRQVWVLDGWRRGEADLWRMDEWIDSTTPFPDTIELEKLWVRRRPAPPSPLVGTGGGATPTAQSP